MSMKVIVGTVALASVFVMGGYMFAHGTSDSITTTVTDKHRVVDRDGDSKWIVMTEDMSFQNSDALWHMKFNSTDIQGKLRVDGTYRIEYYGWRVPVMSMYPNIISVEEVE